MSPNRVPSSFSIAFCTACWNRKANPAPTMPTAPAVALTTANYTFSLLGCRRSTAGLSMSCKSHPCGIDKYLYRGTVWIDATDFAVTRIEARAGERIRHSGPSAPSIHHDYQKLDGLYVAGAQSNGHRRSDGRQSRAHHPLSELQVVDRREGHGPAVSSSGPRMKRASAILGSVIFLVVAPGTIAGYFPWTICGWRFSPPLLRFSSSALLGP